MNIGIWQIVLILVIVLLIFGAGKLPRVMGDFAKGIKSFKSGLKGEETAPPPANTASSETRAVERESGEAEPSATKNKDESTKS